MWLMLLVGWLLGLATVFWGISIWALLWPEKGRHEQVD